MNKYMVRKKTGEYQDKDIFKTEMVDAVEFRIIDDKLYFYGKGILKVAVFEDHEWDEIVKCKKSIYEC